MRTIYLPAASEVLDRLIRELGLGNDAELARAMDTSRSTVSSWRTRNSIPFAACVHLCAERGIDLNSVLLGNAADGGSREDGGVYRPQDFDENFALVPRYRVAASAGHGAQNDAEEIDGHVAFRRDWLRKEGLHVRTLATLYARGDSMAPTIRDRALLLVDTAVTEALDEGVYLVGRDDGSLSVKRLQPVGHQRLRIISDNPAYPPIDLPSAEVAVKGAVMLVSQRP